MRQILIDIDALFDTRLSVLYRLDPEAADHVRQNEDYWRREHTDWWDLTGGRITDDAFQIGYDARTKEDLTGSLHTNLVVVLYRLLTEYQKNMADEMVKDDVGVVVNTWPYGFVQEEKDDLTQIFQELFYTDLPVDYVELDIDALDPGTLNERYSAWLLYDFHRWFKRHHLNLMNRPCRGLDCITPRLFEKSVSHWTTEQKKRELTGFRFTYLEYMPIDFIDAAWFSMCRPEQVLEDET